MNELNTIASLGLTMPTPSYLAGIIIFSIIGMYAWSKGKRIQNRHCRYSGLVLMLYSYLVSNTAMLWLIGAALTGYIFMLIRES